MAPNAPIRVLVVDDSAFMRRALRTMLEKHEAIQVVGTASNGLRAIEEVKRLQPDVVTLDIEMPEMDGLTALRQIRRISKAAVLMVSSLTSEGSQASLSALRAGASDFIAKDLSQVSLDIVKIEQELVAKVCAIAKANQERASLKLPGHLPEVCQSQRPPLLNARDFDLLVIGSSTGGPPVLEQIISCLPAEWSIPVVIAQHMPVLFTRTLAERMNKMSRVEVLHAENGLPLQKGCVYIGQGGQHVRVRKLSLARYEVEVSPNPAEALYKPSVNELFASAAETFGSRVLAIVLTGMGDDGLRGGRTLHARGGKLIAQSHETCAVYGMPKAVTQEGLIIASLGPEDICKTLLMLGQTARTLPPAASRPL